MESPPLRLQFLQWEWRAQGRTTNSPSIVGHIMGAPTLLSSHEDCREICIMLNHWECDCDEEEGKGLQQSAQESWQSKFIPAGPQQSFQSAALLICTNNVVVHSDQGTSWSADLLDLCTISNEAFFLALEPGLSSPRQELSHRPTCLGECLLVPFGQRGC